MKVKNMGVENLKEQILDGIDDIEVSLLEQPGSFGTPAVIVDANRICDNMDKIRAAVEELRSRGYNPRLTVSL